ncbi:MAG: hypothetical protein IPP28_02405 [Xanthomonadales bacterium]|nr:hypothetical protein [Xanthomonadales bacterium]
MFCSEAIDGFGRADESAVVAAADAPTSWQDELTTQGFLVGELRRVDVRSSGRRRRLVFSGLGGLEVDADRRVVVVDADVPSAARPEVMLGPGLLLLLAMDGVLALHASAIAHGGRTILFCGVSGSGKSSIARQAAACGAETLVDDIAPCRIAPTPQLLPRFPQLKWAQPLSGADRAIGIDQIVFVERGTAALGAAIVCGRDAFAADPALGGGAPVPRALLRWHLDAVTAFTRGVPALRMSWPECAEAAIPGQVAAALARLSAW